VCVEYMRSSWLVCMCVRVCVYGRREGGRERESILHIQMLYRHIQIMSNRVHG
jgi:hypothetical protein